MDEKTNLLDREVDFKLCFYCYKKISKNHPKNLCDECFNNPIELKNSENKKKCPCNIL